MVVMTTWELPTMTSKSTTLCAWGVGRPGYADLKRRRPVLTSAVNMSRFFLE
jgi:hypothetical protein